MNKKKLIISSAIALVITGTAGAVIQHTQSGAEEVPPIVTQVEDHEERIGNLEQKQEATDSKVEQNTSDIQTLQQSSGTSSGSASGSTAGSSGSTAPASGTSPTPADAASPTPAQPEPAIPVVVRPAPTPDPRTITAVTEQLDGNARSCRYTLFNDGIRFRTESQVVMSDVQCRQVGEVLTR